jgi:hypothetical protein
MAKYEFEFRTGKVMIDYVRCRACTTYACVKADSIFGTGILRIQGGKPVLVTSPEEAKRRCNECLGCEIYCQLYGNKGCKIELEKFGFEKLAI